MSDRLDCVVIGAGIVGLACARAMTRAGREVVILEREEAIGTQTSARNSEIIHAGIHYPPESAKARLCVRGREMIYGYCASHGIAHRRDGKLVVATDQNQLATLEAVAGNARASRVSDLQYLTARQAKALEPNISCVAALFSPSTGLVDSHALMLALLGDAEAGGAMLALGSPVTRGHVEKDGIALEVGGAAPTVIRAGQVINSAGLWAQSLAGVIDGIRAPTIPPRHLARGVYFTLTGRQPFSRPIYPVPEPGGLGCHYTLDLGGQGKFGPDVEWVDEIDYSVDPARSSGFYSAIRRYWPDLPDGALQPGYAGIRPKLSGPGDPASDFMIQGPLAHGVPGLVNLYGIESPGLTSCLAIAEEVRQLLDTGR